VRRLVLLVLLLLAIPAAAAPRPGFGWPLAGSPVVDRGFDPPRTAYGAGHRGVDLRAVVGQPVLAAGAGRVSYAGLLAGRGVVTVTHTGGLRTTYEPVTASVHVGQVVTRGAVLGHLTTGHASCRARTHCLHWGLLRGDTYLDPLSLVVSTRVRLLPLGGTLAVPRGRPPLPLGNPAAVPLGGMTAVPPRNRPTPIAVARPAASGGWSGQARSAGAAATGALLLGIGLLARRRPA